MIEPQPHVILIFLFALFVMMVTYFAGGRLRVAGTVLFGSFATVLYGQLVLGLVAPSLTVLSAACDMITLGCIGWVLTRATNRAGLHLAAFAMLMSLTSHVVYHLFETTPGATSIYYWFTNGAMVVACVGLFISGFSELVGKYEMAFGIGGHHRGSFGGAARVVARYRGKD